MLTLPLARRSAPYTKVPLETLMERLRVRLRPALPAPVVAAPPPLGPRLVLRRRPLPITLLPALTVLPASPARQDGRVGRPQTLTVAALRPCKGARMRQNREQSFWYIPA